MSKMQEMAWRKKQKAGGGDSPKPPTPNPVRKGSGAGTPKPPAPKPAADGGDEPPAGMSKMQ